MDNPCLQNHQRVITWFKRLEDESKCMKEGLAYLELEWVFLLYPFYVAFGLEKINKILR